MMDILTKWDIEAMAKSAADNAVRQPQYEIHALQQEVGNLRRELSEARHAVERQASEHQYAIDALRREFQDAIALLEEHDETKIR